MAQLPHHAWKTMNKKDLRQFAAAVFFLFAAIGPLTLLMDSSIIPASWVRLAVMTLLSGGFSWAIVQTFSKPFRLIIVITSYVLIIISLSFFKSEFPQTDVPEIFVQADDPFPLSSMQLTDIETKRVVFGMTAVTCIVIGYALFVRALEKANRRRAEIEAEVQLARVIHESLLPKGTLTMAWCDAAGRSIAAAQIGGDFYDCIPISDDRMLAVVADASGHGAGAGILSAMTKSGIIQELRHTHDPSILLKQVNATIHSVTKKNMFVTCAVALFDRSSNSVTLVTAGHPPILRFNAATGTVDEFRTHNLALGIAPTSIFSSITIPYSQGDCFCLITDGLCETCNPSQEQFGMERITLMVKQLSSQSLPAENISDALIDSVTQFGRGNVLNDDITTLVVRIN